MSKPGGIRDLTSVHTVYTAQLKTVRVKLRASISGSQEFELITIARVADIRPVLDTIFLSLDDDQEHFIILVLNVASELVGYKVISSGMQDRVYVDPKLVFRNALLLGAHSIILAHNHPTGDPAPSSLDVMLTGSLVLGGRLLGLDVLDHIIYTRKEHLSLRQTKPALFADPGESGGDT